MYKCYEKRGAQKPWPAIHFILWIGCGILFLFLLETFRHFLLTASDKKTRKAKSASQKITSQNTLSMWEGYRVCIFKKCQTKLAHWHNRFLFARIFLSSITALFFVFEITHMWWIVMSFSECFSGVLKQAALQPEEDETRTNKWNQEPLWQFHHM